MYDEAAPARRDADHSAATRLTGLSGQQLAVQFIGGLLLAAVVGGLSAWATQQVMSEQLTALSRQLDEVRTDLRQMRQDLYAPRLRNSHLTAMAPPPCRSPAAPGDPTPAQSPPTSAPPPGARPRREIAQQSCAPTKMPPPGRV